MTSLASEFVYSISRGLLSSLSGIWLAFTGGMFDFGSATHRGLLYTNGVLFLLPVLLYRLLIIPYVLREAPQLGEIPYNVLVLVWFVPLWFYSVFSNALSHQAIASAMLHRHGRSGRNASITIASRTSPTPRHISNSSSSSSSATSDVASVVYRMLVFGVFQLICFSSGFLPWIGWVLQGALYSWTFSTYCFEYKWRARNKMTLLQCLEYFESRWLYFVGFGMPLTLVSYVSPSYWISYPIVQISIPLFCASAIAGPDPVEQLFVPRLHLRAVTDAAILRPLVSFVQSKRQSKKRNDETRPNSRPLMASPGSSPLTIPFESSSAK
jgi:hypothetical protein